MKARKNQERVWLADQVVKSEFFHQKLHEYGLLEVAYAVENVAGEELEWDLEELRISRRAWNKVIHQGIKPVCVFAHPQVLITIPRSAGYYRGLAMVPLKSMSRIHLNIGRFESGRSLRPPSTEKAWAIARRLNELICRLIEHDESLDPREFDLWRGMTAGSTAQGAWQNRKGQIVERLIKDLIRRCVYKRGLASEPQSHERRIRLKDGRLIEYGDEPDVAVYSAQGHILAAVEIKGGIDPAGTLERVGAALKSLSRVKEQNPSAVTVLLVRAAAATGQTSLDLQIHRAEIDYWATIEEVLAESGGCQHLLDMLGL